MTRSSQADEPADADEPAGAGAAWTADRFLDQWGLQASQAGAFPSAGRTNLALIVSGVDAHAA